MSDLKRCPFCGSKAEIIKRYSAGYHTDVFYVRCVICNSMNDDYFTEAKAIEAWNRRSERMAKVDRDAIFPVTVCGVCHSTVTYPNNYCSGCGAKLDWSER